LSGGDVAALVAVGDDDHDRRMLEAVGCPPEATNRRAQRATRLVRLTVVVQDTG
jgi:hypothetical protein